MVFSQVLVGEPGCASISANWEVLPWTGRRHVGAWPTTFESSTLDPQGAKEEAEEGIAPPQPEEKAVPLDEVKSQALPYEDPDAVEGEPDLGGHFDTALPRKLKNAFRLRRSGVHELDTPGLRVMHTNLYICNSDTDAVLEKEGKCGLVGNRWKVNGYTLKQKRTGMTVFPVRRWDDSKLSWTAEDAPIAKFQNRLLLYELDGRLDMEATPPMPLSMTEPLLGEPPEAIEGLCPLWVPPPPARWSTARVATRPVPRAAHSSDRRPGCAARGFWLGPGAAV